MGLGMAMVEEMLDRVFPLGGREHTWMFRQTGSSSPRPVV